MTDEIEAWHRTGKWLFAQACVFIKGATKVANLPSESLSEVAFVGRSNVGKSSLINALTNRKKMARVSSTPGRTQEINFFSLGSVGILVDLPGYGYAQVSKDKRLSWAQFIFDYLKGRSVLKRVYVLIDSRHGLKKSDMELFQALNTAAVSYQIILTKCDKTTQKNLEKIQQQTADQLKNQPAAHPHILSTSSQNGKGLEEVKTEIAQLFLSKPQ